MAQKPKKVPKIGDMVVGDIDANRYSGYEVDVDIVCPVAVTGVEAGDDGEVIVHGIAHTEHHQKLNSDYSPSVPIRDLVYGAEEHSWEWPDEAEQTAAAKRKAEEEAEAKRKADEAAAEAAATAEAEAAAAAAAAAATGS